MKQEGRKQEGYKGRKIGGKEKEEEIRRKQWKEETNITGSRNVAL